MVVEAQYTVYCTSTKVPPPECCAWGSCPSVHMYIYVCIDIYIYRRLCTEVQLAQSNDQQQHAPPT